MVALAVGAQDPVVRHVAEQRVLEQELAGGGELGDLALQHDLVASQVSPGSRAPGSHLPRCRRRGGRRRGPRRPGRPPRRAGPGGVPPLLSESRRDCRTPLSVEGTATVRTSSSTTNQCGSAADDDAGVDQPADQLLDVERVALGAVDDEAHQVVGEVLDVAQDLPHQFAALPSRERVEREPHVVGQSFAPPGVGPPAARAGSWPPPAPWTRRGPERRRRAIAACPRRPSAGPRGASPPVPGGRARGSTPRGPRCPGRAASAVRRAGRRCRRARRTPARRRPGPPCVARPPGRRLRRSRR